MKSISGTLDHGRRKVIQFDLAAVGKRLPVEEPNARPFIDDGEVLRVEGQANGVAFGRALILAGNLEVRPIFERKVMCLPIGTVVG